MPITLRRVRLHNTVGSEEYYKAVAEEYNNAIEQTQPMYDVLHRPEIQKNKNALSREIFMFKTQSFQNSGILQSSFGRLQAAKRHLHTGGESAQAEYDAARKGVASAIVSQTLSLTVLTAMTVLANGFALHKLDKYRNDKGKIDLVSFFREVGLVFGGNAATLILPYSSTVFSLADFARNKLTGSTFYGVSSPTLDFINGFTESASKLYDQIDVLRDGDKKGSEKLISVGGALYDVLAKYCEFKGIAMSNTVNILNSIRLSAEDAFAGRWFDGKGIQYEAGYQQSESQVYQLMYEAVLDGDTDTYEEYKKRLMSGYHTSADPIEGVVGYFTEGKPVTEKDITDGIAKVLRSDEKVHGTALSYLSSDFYNYDEGLSELEKIGFSEEMVNKATNAVIDAATELYKADVGSEEYDTAEEKLYEYGFGAEDIAAILEAIDNIEVYNGEGSLTSRGLKYSYKMLAEAVVDGDVDSAVRIYTYLTDEAEKEDKTIRSQLTQYIKPIYKKATNSERTEIRQLLMKHCGYKFDSFKGWLKD